MNHLRRRLIVWYYKNKEPYKSRRLERKLNKFLRNFRYGLMAIGNNIEPMIKAFNDAKVAIGNVGKAFEKQSEKN